MCLKRRWRVGGGGGEGMLGGKCGVGTETCRCCSKQLWFFFTNVPIFFSTNDKFGQNRVASLTSYWLLVKLPHIGFVSKKTRFIYFPKKDRFIFLCFPVFGQIWPVKVTNLSSKIMLWIEVIPLDPENLGPWVHDTRLNNSLTIPGTKLVRNKGFSTWSRYRK